MTTACLIAETDPFIAGPLPRFAEASGPDCVRARSGQEILQPLEQTEARSR
jgi:hypothetical protein